MIRSKMFNVGRYGYQWQRIHKIRRGLRRNDKKNVQVPLKLQGNSVEVTKKGPVTAHLSFVPGEKTMTFYETPYGNIYLGIFSRSVDMQRTEDKLTISIDYALELNYEQVSDCKVDIEISSKGKFSLLS